MQLASLILLAASVFGQVTPNPDVKLNVPTRAVAFSRFVKMSIDPINKTTTSPYDFVSYVVDWDVTERDISDNPLENDLDIDSNGMKAIIPSGDHSTSVKISVNVTFIYKDNSTRVVKVTQYVQIGLALPPNPAPPPGPTPVPVPGPVPVPTPPPGPTPVPVPVPVPVAETFGATTFSKTLLSKSTLSKADAAALAIGFHSVAELTRNQAANLTKEEVVKNMAERNTAVLTPTGDLNAWIDGFLKPLQTFLNPISPKIKTVLDQATLYDEIGNGLDAYAGSK